MYAVYIRLRESLQASPKLCEAVLTTTVQFVTSFATDVKKCDIWTRELFCDFDLITIILNLYPSFRNRADLSGAFTEAFDACCFAFRCNYGKTHSHIKGCLLYT